MPDDIPQTAQTVGVIDIGSNAVRMTIAEVTTNDKIRVLEQLHRGVRLGQDTFRRGRLSAATMRAAVAILRDYQQMLQFYQVRQVRAVATSAVREAANSDAFLDRIYMATGLDVELIVTSEESRLTVSAVYQDFDRAGSDREANTLIADVGGGDTLLTQLEDGEIAESHSLRLGSIRLQEMLSTASEPAQQAANMLRQQIGNQISVIQSSMPLQQVTKFIAVGKDARFIESQIGKPLSELDLSRVPRKKFQKLVDTCIEYTTEELTRKYGLAFADAETLNPALLVYQMLLEETKAKEIMVSPATMRDGLLLDMARRVTGREDDALVQGVVHSALALAEKYRADLKHAVKVADLALAFFDKLGTLHGLKSRHRLLQVAGLIHDIGAYVSLRAHHKHSFYLINHSEIFGLTRNEQDIVAHVARYHRRSTPKTTHLEYMQLPRERRMIVSKLAALLRVADVLDISHMQLVRDFRCEQTEEELIIYVSGVTDLSLKRRALSQKGDLFEEIYGLNVRLENEPRLRDEQ